VGVFMCFFFILKEKIVLLVIIHLPALSKLEKYFPRRIICIRCTLPSLSINK